MNRRIAQQFRNIETNFTKLIDQIIFYDSVDSDDEAIEILQGIVNIDIDKQIDLLFEDLKYRNYAVETAEIYNVIWYSMVGEKEQADLLVKKISESPDKDSIVTYLWYLNAGYNDGNKTEEEFDIEEVLYAVRKGEQINHRKLLKKMIKNIEISFSDLVDRVIFYDSVDQDVLSYDIIIEIEKIPTDKLIKLMIKELHRRDYKISTPLMYNFMWYYFADFHDKSNMLVKEILKTQNKEKILNYLSSLNERTESDSELNIQDVIDAVNQNTEIIETEKLKFLFNDVDNHFELLINKMLHYEKKIQDDKNYYFLGLSISQKISNIDINNRIDLLIEYTANNSQITKESMFHNILWIKASIYGEILRAKIKKSSHYNTLVDHFNSIYKHEDGSINIRIIETINSQEIQIDITNKNIIDTSNQIIKQNKENCPELFNKDPKV